MSRAALAAGLAVLMLAAGCGGERNFDAETVVEELNAAGTQLALGEPLPSSAEGVEVTVVTFTGGAGPLEGDAHGAGAVVILDDAAAAREEFRRCESAISFVCYRAANAVLRFSQISADERAQIGMALAALETEQD